MKTPKAKRPPAIFNPRLAAFKIMQELQQSPVHLQNRLEREFALNPQAAGRDKAFCQNLLYSALRNLLWLEFELGQLRDLNTLEFKARALLVLAAAELKFFRTPSYAAVSAWVDVSKKSGLTRLSGLVNGILRALLRLPAPPRVPESDLAQFLSITYSHPLWLCQSWLGQFGEQATKAWLESRQEEPPLTLRVNTLKTSIPELTELLSQHAQSVATHPLAPLSLVVQNPAFPLPGFKEGLWQGQDPGATALTQLLGARPGSRVLDMCAGVGGKTGHLAGLMQNQGELTACEISPGRMGALRQNLARLGVSNARLCQMDATTISDKAAFDYILLDAPCSGLGTTRRRPDLRLRRAPEDIASLLPLQRALLATAATALKPGGFLLYATCTTTWEENDGNIEWLLANHPGMRLSRPHGLPEGQRFWQTFPQRADCDGFFAARLQKTE